MLYNLHAEFKLNEKSSIQTTSMVAVIAAFVFIVFVLYIIGAFHYSNTIFICINLFIFITSIVITSMYIGYYNKISQSDKDIQNNINELDEIKASLEQAGIDLENQNILNTLTNLEKIIYILQYHFNDDSNTICTLLTKYLATLQSMNTDDIVNSLNVLNKLNVTEMDILLNQINIYLTNDININELINLLQFIAKYQHIFSLFTMNNINRLIILKNKLNDVNVQNLTTLFNNIDNISLLTTFINNLNTLQQTYNINTEDLNLLTNQIINTSKNDVDKFNTAMQIINILQNTPINISNTIGDLNDNNKLIDMLYIYKFMTPISDNNIMINLVSVPISINPINAYNNSLIDLSTQTTIPLRNLINLI